MKEEYDEAEFSSSIERIETLYSKYMQFEEYTFKAEEEQYSEFLIEWQKRQTCAIAAGFSYSDLMLAFKLLKNSCLESEAQSAVFAVLQSDENKSTEKVLAQTMICLNEIMCSGASHTIKVEDLEEVVKKDQEDVEDNMDDRDGSESPDFGGDEYSEDVKPDQSKDLDSKTKSKSRCKVCGVLVSDSWMLQHLISRHGMKPVCTHCGEEFLRNSQLVNHLKDAHPTNYMEETLPCTQCDKRFMDITSIQQHTACVHNKKHGCNIDQCEYTCNRLALLKRHQQTMHFSEKAAAPARRVPSVYKKKTAKSKKEKIEWDEMKGFQCDQCGEEVLDVSKIKPHIRSHFQFKCQPCKNKRFKTQEELEAHILKHETFPCEECDQVFTLNSKLTAHKVSQHGMDPRKYACDICGKLYRSSSNLINHKLFHGEKKFHCVVEGCGRSYVVKTKLREHIMFVHTGEKNFNCEECGKGFVNTYRLKVHQDRHRGIKRFPCDLCEKRFFDNGKLTVHRRIHTGERPYRCTGCDKTFVQSKDLKLHKEKLHPTL